MLITENHEISQAGNFTQDDLNRCKSLEEKLLVAVSLIERLSNQGYVLLSFPTNAPSGAITYGQIVQGTHRLSYPINDPQIAKRICDLMQCQTTGLPDLVDLQKHDFVTPEDRQFRDQLAVAKKGVKAAYFGSAIAVLIAISANVGNAISTKGYEEKLTDLISIAEEQTNSLNGIASSLEKIANNPTVDLSELDFATSSQLIEMQTSVDKGVKKLEDIEKKLDAKSQSAFNEAKSDLQNPN